MTQGCHLAEQFHYAGQSWHPYIPPAGFDTCTICTCESRYLVVQCTNVQCPTLSCPEKVAYRPDKKSCCKVCPEVSIVKLLHLLIFLFINSYASILYD